MRLVLVSMASLCVVASAQSPGLRLFQPVNIGITQMVDNLGNVVHSWPGAPNFSCHLDNDGKLLRTRMNSSLSVSGAYGQIDRLALDSTLEWSFPVNGPFNYGHHDIEVMPNGNLLLIAWDRYTVADAIAQGRDPALVSGSDWLPDAILEVQPTPTGGTIVWEWHMMDHVIQDFDPGKPNYGVVANHPELLDLNFPPEVVSNGDWNHLNGIDYCPISDWIIISARQPSELYIVDHSTTTAEAAGHTGGVRGKGGDFLWRWGNPEAYDAGTVAHRQLGFQHDPRFVPPGFPGAGNVTVFDNAHTAITSAVHELVLPTDAQGNLFLDPISGRFGPVSPVWTFTAPGFFSFYVAGAERLPNGNTLVCSGLQNLLMEVTPAGQVIWGYNDPTLQWMFHSYYVDRSLWSDVNTIAASGGGTVRFDHLLGSAHAGDVYFLLGSMTGTSPGFNVAGVQLPLNFDYLLGSSATLFNIGIFVNTLGTLDANGRGTSRIVVPPGYIPSAVVGTELHFAHLIYSPTLLPLRSGNPVKITIVP